MKKIIIFVMLFAGIVGIATPIEAKELSTFFYGGATNNIPDTTLIDINSISKVIEDNQTNKAGKTSTKYYFIYKDELVDTNKTTINKYNVAKKHNAKIKLLLITTKTNKRKIIVN